MRKRSIIAGLLTLGILCLTSGFWLDNKRFETKRINTHKITSLKFHKINKKQHKHIKFEFEIFVIILILSYLLSYKLIDYLADFKTIKDKSRIEIAFLTIFFVLLFIPMMHISDDKTSESENRTLAKWYPFITSNGKINYNFGKDFDQWYNDRFFMRSNLVDIASLYLYARETGSVLFGKDDWLFLKVGKNDEIRNFQNSEKLSEKDLEKIGNYLSQINDYCNLNNKHFYLLIAPDKHKIYGEYFPGYVKKLAPDTESRANQTVKYLENMTKINVIYPYDVLHSLKDTGLLYWKTDSHWNYYGGFIAYKELVNKIVRDGINIKIFNNYEIKKQKRPKGDLWQTLPKLKQLKIKDLYQYNTYVSAKKYKENFVKYPDRKPDIFTYNDIDAPNIVVYRDSFFNSVQPYISDTFKNASFYRKFDVVKSEIEHADVVVIEVVERNIKVLTNGRMYD